MRLSAGSHGLPWNVLCCSWGIGRASACPRTSFGFFADAVRPNSRLTEFWAVIAPPPEPTGAWQAHRAACGAKMEGSGKRGAIRTAIRAAPACACLPLKLPPSRLHRRSDPPPLNCRVGVLRTPLGGALAGRLGAARACAECCHTRAIESKTLHFGRLRPEFAQASLSKLQPNLALLRPTSTIFGPLICTEFGQYGPIWINLRSGPCPESTRFGRKAIRLGPIWPISAKLGLTSVEFGPPSAKFWPTSTDFSREKGEFDPEPTNFGRNSANCRLKSSEFRPPQAAERE